MDNGEVISVKNVVKVYNRLNKKNLVVALKGVSFSIEKGKIFGFLGPNGSGKTTVIKIILGIIPQTSGEVKVLNTSPMSRESKKYIGYLPESLYYPDFINPVKLLEFYAGLYGMNKKKTMERIDYVLSLVGLEDKKKTKLREFSKGMLQRFGIAQAILHDPQLYIFDEPASGLDPGGQRLVRDIMIRLRDEGKTIFFSSHQLSEAEMVCNNVAIVNKGEIITCAPLEDLLISGSKIDLSQSYSIIFELTEGKTLDNLTSNEKLGMLNFEGTSHLKVITSGKEETN
ncbi:MAG TPA: ABC transporter ATP-binding protein, partial [Candidatus Eremiobacteraeota bacterium]|nr:ABC transporter ATP-binding protein [Candidatus Eremiobacteraeota bacterium]